MSTDSAGTITVEADDAVRVVTLNRPDHANAVNNAMHTSFARLWDELAEDPEARAVVLTGAGDKFFSAGGDLAEWLHVLRASHTDNEDTARQLAGLRAVVAAP